MIPSIVEALDRYAQACVVFGAADSVARVEAANKVATAARVELVHVIDLALLEEGPFGLRAQVATVRAAAEALSAERAELLAVVERLKAVIDETFNALVASGPQIGDLARHGLPYAVVALAAERDEARRSGHGPLA